jgi:hypothetical protein
VDPTRFGRRRLLLDLTALTGASEFLPLHASADAALAALRR